MQLRQRSDTERPPAPTALAPGDGGALDQMAQQAATFASAGQAIINAALSGDSQAFLQATRQSGGQ